MYRKLKRRLFKLTLKNTPDERLIDEITKNTIKIAEKSGYLTDDTTDLLLKLISRVDTATEVVGSKIETVSGAICGAEASSSIGRIAYKTTRDIAKGDNFCTGLCLASGVAETVALVCSTVKIIPFRGKIYVGAKCISQGCMNFRNLCAGEGC